MILPKLNLNYLFTEVVPIYSEKKLVIVSHCILNQNAVVQDLERARGAFPLATYLLQQGISFLQLPCPELLTLGSNRPPMTYEDYSSLANYRQQCKEMLDPIIQQIVLYKNNDYHYLGIIGIEESPNCAISKKRGVLMEEFFFLCDKLNLPQNYFEVPIWYHENNQGNLNQKLDHFIKNKGESQ